jgi:hypothetical protein
MLGLVVLLAKTPHQETHCGRHYLFLVYERRVASICGLYFSVRKTYIVDTKGALLGANRSAGRKNKN